MPRSFFTCNSHVENYGSFILNDTLSSYITLDVPEVLLHITLQNRNSVAIIYYCIYLFFFAAKN